MERKSSRKKPQKKKRRSEKSWSQSHSKEPRNVKSPNRKSQSIRNPLQRKKSQPRKLLWKRRSRKSGDGSAKSRVTRGNNFPSNYANVSDKSCSVDEDWAFKSGGFPKSGARLGFSLVI